MLYEVQCVHPSRIASVYATRAEAERNAKRLGKLRLNDQGETVIIRDRRIIARIRPVTFDS